MVKKVAVAGASGYAGGEILRILKNHPDFEVVTVTGHSTAGQKLTKSQPHLRSYDHLTLKETTAANLNGHDAVFFALPHGASGELSSELEEGAVLIDCGADHRLESELAWQEYYGDNFNAPWAYGVPELLIEGGSHKQRDKLVGAKKIAAPGCNASTVALSLAPAIADDLIDTTDVVSTLAVGPSGAGKALQTHLLASELMGNANPYAVGGTHRHIPEILQAFQWSGAKNPAITFTPILVPMPRGILATTSARIKHGVSATQIISCWQERYANEHFIRVLQDGEQPTTARVLGTNMCEMSVNVDRKSGRVTVVAAVDNLVKGTAGAAIQSANIAFGFEETTALAIDGVTP